MRAYLYKYFEFKAGHPMQKKVITYGTFDMLHTGHIRLLERAAGLGNFLIVALSTDEFNIKKHKQSFYPFEERKFILESVRHVDLVIPENEWAQKESDIINHQIDVFVMGDDWKGEFDSLSDFCEVVYLERTPGISTSAIKSELASS